MARPLRLATHAVLLLCVTTLGLFVTWQLVSFAGTARPLPGPDGTTVGTEPWASRTVSPDVVIADATPQAVVSPGSPDDRHSSSGGDPHGDGTPRATSHPASTPGSTPTAGPTATPTAAPTPTDTPTAAPTDTPPQPTDTPTPPPTDTPAPPTDTPAPPTDTPGP